MTRLRVRELRPDDDEAIRLVAAAGAHGVYVQNALAQGDGDGFVVDGGAAALALSWLGPRGNLVVVAPEPVPDRVAQVVSGELAGRARPWRIAMGPAAIVDVLRQQVPGTPLVWRDQVYYAGAAGTAARELVADERAAVPADRDRLVQATLLLNHSDLNIDPARVDRRWLRDTVDERIHGGTTRVLGPVGGVLCKLDYGSDGPGGRVFEGVFTFPEHRGKGFAAALVATCLANAPGPVSLHVGKHNRPARSAYERAGMSACGGCRLLLSG